MARGGFNTASGMDCMQLRRALPGVTKIPVSIPQAVWIACNLIPATRAMEANSVSIPQAVWIACNRQVSREARDYTSFNTASGMDCMQFEQAGLATVIRGVSIPQAVWIACNPTAQAMPTLLRVSIPQAVWIACNTVSWKPWKQ